MVLLEQWKNDNKDRLVIIGISFTFLLLFVVLILFLKWT